MNAVDMIDALGGKHSVSLLTGAKPNAVVQWRRIGIPARYWPAFVTEAKRKRVRGITFNTLATTKPARVAVAPVPAQVAA